MADEELTVPGGDGAAPSADTPQSHTTDTAENTPATSQLDYETRYREVQAWATREAQRRRELEDRLLALQAQPKQEAGPPEDETPRERQLRERLEAIEAERQQAEWTLAAQSFGPGITEAYNTFARGVRLDPSPRGILNAYVESIRLLAGPPEQPAPTQAPPPPTGTAVDDNTPAAKTSPAELDRIRAEAVAKKDPRAWLEAQMRSKWGIGL